MFFYRDVEVATEEITLLDKEMQFNNGDDTRLLNIISAIKLRRESRKLGEVITETLLEAADKVNEMNTRRKMNYLDKYGDDEGEEDYNSKMVNTGGKGRKQSMLTAPLLGEVQNRRQSITSSNTNKMVLSLPVNASSRLSSFLQKSSLLCETLLEESLRRNRERITQQEEGKDVDRREKLESIFTDASSWGTLGSGLVALDDRSGKSGRSGKASERLVDSKNGESSDNILEEKLLNSVDKTWAKILSNRETVALRFSLLQPNVLVTAHSYTQAWRSNQNSGGKASGFVFDKSIPTSVKPLDIYGAKVRFCQTVFVRLVFV